MQRSENISPVESNAFKPLIIDTSPSPDSGAYISTSPDENHQAASPVADDDSNVKNMVAMETIREDAMLTNGTRKNRNKRLKPCDICFYMPSNLDEYYDHKVFHFPNITRCPRQPCKFVADNKHHMNYHIKVHDNEKNYHCEQCGYSCQTKSMLTSHEKSHSNISRYQCADCSFTAKHAHVLTMHLEKTGHLPGLVLNQDGTVPDPNDPNANFQNIIRRKRKGDLQSPQSSQKQRRSDTGRSKASRTSARDLFKSLDSEPSLSPISKTTPMTYSNILPFMTDKFLSSPLINGLQFSAALNQFNLPTSLIVSSSQNQIFNPSSLLGTSSPLPIQNYLSNYVRLNPNSHIKDILKIGASDASAANGQSLIQVLANKPINRSQPSTSSSPVAADLSNSFKNESNLAKMEPLDLSQPKLEDQSTQKKSRRKGMAFKLDLSSLQRFNDSDQSEGEGADEIVDLRISESVKTERESHAYGINHLHQKENKIVELVKTPEVPDNSKLDDYPSKKEKSTDCDSALIPLLCVHG